MSIFDNPENLRLLQNLLNPKQRADDSSSDDEEETSPLMKSKILNPANIGPAKGQPPTQPVPHKDNKTNAQLAETPIKSLEEWQAQQEREDSELLETRKCPDYTMTYRQAVGTEDMFLQMGNRSNATSSCEDLVIVIQLPLETNAADKMDLSITATDVDLATSVYRLKLPLPHKVDVDRCSAKYEATERRLRLTLRLQRELDFVNF